MLRDSLHWRLRPAFLLSDREAIGALPDRPPRLCTPYWPGPCAPKCAPKSCCSVWPAGAVRGYRYHPLHSGQVSCSGEYCPSLAMPAEVELIHTVLFVRHRVWSTCLAARVWSMTSQHGRSTKVMMCMLPSITSSWPSVFSPSTTPWHPAILNMPKSWRWPLSEVSSVLALSRLSLSSLYTCSERARSQEPSYSLVSRTISPFNVHLLMNVGIAVRAVYSIGAHRTEVNSRFGHDIRRHRYDALHPSSVT